MIELLVTVAIIAILAGLLLVGAGKSIRQARRAECLNSQRQLNLFRQMEEYYSLEFRDGETYLDGLPVARWCYDCHPSIP